MRQFVCCAGSKRGTWEGLARGAFDVGFQTTWLRKYLHKHSVTFCLDCLKQKNLIKHHGLRQVVVSNAPSCGGVAYAEERGIPTLRYPGRQDDPNALTPERLVAELRDAHRVDVVCLAGYMKASSARRPCVSCASLHLQLTLHHCARAP